MTDFVELSEYSDWLGELKRQIKTEQIKATLSVNSKMIMLYWDLGGQIVEKQAKSKWGDGFIEQLGKDLKEEFPEVKGFSADNLKYMRIFYKFYSSIGERPVRQSETQITKQFVSLLSTTNPEESECIENYEIVISEQLVRQFTCVPWGHHMLILKKIKYINQALFYINKTIENSWSRAVLEYQIESDLYGRQGKAINNFNMTLPEPQSDLANEMIKDPYNFDFLCLSEKVKETDLEKALVQHISQFLPELGIGFAYMGRQVALKVAQKEYRTDLLFYHTHLKCYIVVELKTKEFEPEFIGKLNFYIALINENIKDDTDKQTIGILLCKNKDNYEVEFALKDINNPIGVSTFHYTELTDDIKSALPTIQTLQNELIKVEREYEKR